MTDTNDSKHDAHAAAAALAARLRAQEAVLGDHARRLLVLRDAPRAAELQRLRQHAAADANALDTLAQVLPPQQLANRLAAAVRFADIRFPMLRVNWQLAANHIEVHVRSCSNLPDPSRSLVNGKSWFTQVAYDLGFSFADAAAARSQRSRRPKQAPASTSASSVAGIGVSTIAEDSSQQPDPHVAGATLVVEAKDQSPYYSYSRTFTITRSRPFVRHCEHKRLKITVYQVFSPKESDLIREDPTFNDPTQHQQLATGTSSLDYVLSLVGHANRTRRTILGVAFVPLSALVSSNELELQQFPLMNPSNPRQRLPNDASIELSLKLQVPLVGKETTTIHERIIQLELDPSKQNSNLPIPISTLLQMADDPSLLSVVHHTSGSLAAAATAASQEGTTRKVESQAPSERQTPVEQRTSPKKIADRVIPSEIVQPSHPVGSAESPRQPSQGVLDLLETTSLVKSQMPQSSSEDELEKLLATNRTEVTKSFPTIDDNRPIDDIIQEAEQMVAAAMRGEVIPATTPQADDPLLEDAIRLELESLMVGSPEEKKPALEPVQQSTNESTEHELSLADILRESRSVDSDSPKPSVQQESKSSVPPVPSQKRDTNLTTVPTTAADSLPSLDVLKAELFDASKIPSNAILEKEVKRAELAMATPHPEWGEVFSDKEQAETYKMNIQTRIDTLVALVQSGALDPTSYATSLRAAIQRTRQIALAFKRSGEMGLAKEALVRAKLMQAEIEEMEAVD